MLNQSRPCICSMVMKVIAGCQEVSAHLYVAHDVQCSRIVALGQQQVKGILRLGHMIDDLHAMQPKVFHSLCSAEACLKLMLWSLWAMLNVIGNLTLAVVMHWQMQFLNVCFTTAGFAFW